MKTIRKLEILGYLGQARLAPSTRDVENHVNGKADAGDARTLRSVQRDLRELRLMGLVESVQDGGEVRWMLCREEAA